MDTEAKIKGFTALKPGVIQGALDLLHVIAKQFPDTGAFADEDGSVAVTGYHGDHYICVTVRESEQCSLNYEVGHETWLYLDDLPLRPRVSEVAVVVRATPLTSVLPLSAAVVMAVLAVFLAVGGIGRMAGWW